MPAGAVGVQRGRTKRNEMNGTAERNGSQASGRRFSWWTALPVVVFAGLAGLFFVGLGSGDPSRVPSPLINKPAPDFTLPRLAGLVVNGEEVAGFGTADLKSGDVSIVNIWASWCVPCRDEHPYLMRLSEKSGVRVFGINYKDRAQNARRFLGLHGNPFDAVGVDEDGRRSVDWGVYAVPETFIVDGDGTITFKWIGPINEATFNREILPAIEAARRGHG